MNREVTIETGEYGPRAVLHGPWSNGLERYLLAHDVVDLELNHAKGWSGESIEFLTLLPDLLAITVIDLRIASVSPVHELHGLRSLRLTTYCKTPIQFEAFPSLVDCGLEWRPGSESLFECTTLRRLFVNRYSGKGFSGFSQLVDLENLGILGGALQDLMGIDRLRGLRHLRLGDLRSLKSLDPLGGLKDLRHLQVQVCRRINDISAVARLEQLRTLLLENCGDIESLQPIAGLPQLESVLFYGSTNIVDGDLTPLLRLKNLKSVSFQNRRHYSHRREQFAAGLAS